MEPYWDLIKEIIRESDIILEVLDARAIEISRNKEVEKYIAQRQRPKIYVINKIDLVDKKELEKNVEILRHEILDNKEKAEIAFVSNKKWRTRTTKILFAKIRTLFSKYGKRPDFNESTTPLIKKPFREAKSNILIGVVGYPNVGKSSVINALAFKTKSPVSSKAGTTHGVHWISVNEDMKLIDTPGVIPLAYGEESKLAFIASKNPEKLKEPDVAAARIIEEFLKAEQLKKLEEFFQVQLDEKENPYLILEEIALKKGHLKKGGLPDDIRMSILLTKAWQTGKLKL